MENQGRRPPIEDDSSVFPCEIMENILCRLPVKSLVRFRTVCKSWKAIINDPAFHRIHFNQPSISDSLNLLVKVDGKYRLIHLQGENKEFHEHYAVQFPSKGFDSAELLCCSAGIGLFKGSISATRRKYMLLNPFTRTSLTFSCPFVNVVHDNNSYHTLNYGVCIDEHDCKVIFLIIGSRYLVYSTKNDTWADRRSEFGGKARCNGTYADGAVYWLKYLPGTSSILIYFDPKDCMLKQLQCPEDSKHENDRCMLQTHGADLSFSSWDEEHNTTFWLLKVSSGRKLWIKFMTIKKRQLGFPFECPEYGFPCLESLNCPALARKLFCGASHVHAKALSESENVAIYEIEVSLELLYLGTVVECPLSWKAYCLVCRGKGKIILFRDRMMPYSRGMSEGCSNCGRRGYNINSYHCPMCKGESTVAKNKVFEIWIEKGMRHGKKFIFEEPNKQVVVLLREKDHPRFKRKGKADLVVEHTVSVFDALCGFQFVLTHLDGRKLLIKTQPGEVVKPDSYKLVEKEGMQRSKHRPNGNLYIHFNVNFPDSINPRVAKSLAQVFPGSKISDEELAECEETKLRDVQSRPGLLQDIDT